MTQELPRIQQRYWKGLRHKGISMRTKLDGHPGRRPIADSNPQLSTRSSSSRNQISSHSRTEEQLRTKFMQSNQRCRIRGCRPRGSPHDVRIPCSQLLIGLNLPRTHVAALVSIMDYHNIANKVPINTSRYRI